MYTGCYTTLDMLDTDQDVSGLCPVTRPQSHGRLNTGADLLIPHAHDRVRAGVELSTGAFVGKILKADG